MAISTDTTSTEVTWCCHHPEHGEGPPGIYSLVPHPENKTWAFGCAHLTEADRRALMDGVVPGHLAPELPDGLTPWGLSGRFRVLAEELVQFKGPDHPDLAAALRLLREAEALVLGCAPTYPLIDEGGAVDAGFVG